MIHFRAIYQSFKHQSKNSTSSIWHLKLPTFLKDLSSRLLPVHYSTETIPPSYRNSLSFHIKNQRLDQARIIFDNIQSPDVQLYTMMITGYAKSHRLNDALALFDKMPVRDTVAWNSMMKGCLDCGDLDLARKLFDEMPQRNVVSWTTIVNGYLKAGKLELAEALFRDMPDKDIAAFNAMIHGYFENEKIEEGLNLFESMPFRNVISWTSVIGGLEQNGKAKEALLVFGKMMSSGVKPTSSTFACSLTACANARNFNLGLQIHGSVVKLGYFYDEFISASLISFYSNCKEIENACLVFNETLTRNVVIWTALLTGYDLNCQYMDALRVFGDMIRTGVLPNQSTFTSAFNSCRGLEALDKGRETHSIVIKLGFETDTVVSNSVIVMYNECGNVKDAVSAFKEITAKNVVSWNSVIVGSSQHGQGKWALCFFSQMIRAYIEPDEITFTGLLSACSHSGMSQKGRSFFNYISQHKPIELKLQHYSCMVDILGRSGKLEEAENLIKTMPMKANFTMWLSLLSACKMHSNLEGAERAAESIFELEPQCSAAYVLLSNIYALAGKWSDVSRVRVKMKQGGITKQQGSSWVVLKGRKHEFRSGDRLHPLSEKIHEKLDWLGGKLKEMGYVPDHRYALHDVEDEQKEEMLAYHSERLAIAFALVSSVEGSTITVMKNLRVCGDCHTVIKLISGIVGREIVVRDSARFHHFHGGLCSCGDFW